MEREVALLKAASECSGVVKMLNVVEDQHHHYTVLEAVPGRVAAMLAAGSTSGHLAKKKSACTALTMLLAVFCRLYSD
jgi:hypothetical protein